MAELVLSHFNGRGWKYEVEASVTGQLCIVILADSGIIEHTGNLHPTEKFFKYIRTSCRSLVYSIKESFVANLEDWFLFPVASGQNSAVRMFHPQC